MSHVINIAIFASGSGTNAENIIQYYIGKSNAQITMVLTNNPAAGVLEKAKRLNVKTVVFNKDDFYASGKVIEQLQNESIDLIVLAGFLWLVPKELIRCYPNRIINIHPALLPKYGGKGMYGMHVHKSVIDNREEKSGITIHFVTEEYDKGDTIFQATCDVAAHDTPESLAMKVHQLEYEHFPKVIDKIAIQLL